MNNNKNQTDNNLIKLEGNDNFSNIIAYEEYFSSSPNYFLYDDYGNFLDKDFASIFRTSSNPLQMENNTFFDNFDDLHSCIDLYQIENIEKKNKKTFDNMSLILHIKSLFYGNQFDEILKFFADNFPNVFILYILFKFFFISNFNI